MPAALDVELLPRADRCPHRQPGGLDQVLQLVPAAQDVVVAVAVTTLVATAAPGPLDLLLRGADEGVGPLQVVAQEVDQAVNVGC